MPPHWKPNLLSWFGKPSRPNWQAKGLAFAPIFRPNPGFPRTTGLPPSGSWASFAKRPAAQHRASFRTSAVRKDVFFVALPSIKAVLLDVSRITLLALPFVWRYRLWKRWPRTSFALLQIPIWAVCIVIALAADQAPNTSRWRLLMMSNAEEQEWAKHRLSASLAEEGPLVLPSSDPRVKQVLRVAERIIAVLGEDCTSPTHYVSAAAWPTSLSPSFYEEYFKSENTRPDLPRRRDRPSVDPEEYFAPSAIATSHLIPHRLESSNPMKVFSEQDWKIYVVDLPKINAYALPTREIFVYTGLVDLLDDDSLLSGVLAHEMAHVTQRHAVENAGFLSLAALAFDTLRGISFAFTISFPLITDAAASALNLIHNHVAEKAYSRKLEMEADAVGLRFMSMAGYHPHAMLDLWDVMAMVEEDAAAAGTPISITDKVPFLKTHPTSLQRQRNIDALLPKALKMYDISPFRHVETAKHPNSPSTIVPPRDSAGPTPDTISAGP